MRIGPGWPEGRRRLLGLTIPLFIVACGDGPTPIEFSVTPDSAALEVGSSLQLTAISAPGRVEWSSSNSSVVEVISETGFVTAVSRGDVLITAVSGSQFASAQVAVRDPPAIALSADAVDFDVVAGDEEPLTATVDVTNAGDGELTDLHVDVGYGEGEADGWLEARLDGSAAPTVLRLEARSAELGAGLHTAVVAVAADGALNSPQVLSVTLAIREPARIVLSPARVDLAGTPDRILTEVVEITNGGDDPLIELAAEVVDSGGGVPTWLTVELDGTDAPTQLVVRADTEGLAVGEYDAVVHVSSGVARVPPIVLPVVLTVSSAPTIGLDPSEVAFAATQGGDPPAARVVAVTNTGGGTLDGIALEPVEYGAGQPQGWLSARLSGTGAPTNLTLSVDHTGLPSGTYAARVPVTSRVAGNSPRSMDVTLTVGRPPELAVSPASLSFSAARGRPNPSAQLVNVTNAGGGTLDGLSALVSYAGGGPTGWLSTSWEAGSTTAPTRLRVQPQTGNLPEGTYDATIEIRSTAEGVAPRTVTVRFRVALSFDLDVWPILSANTNTNCLGCHFSGGTIPNLHTASVAFSNLRNGVSGKGPWVIPNEPASGSPALMCLLDWEQGCSKMPPVSQLGLEQRNRIRRWILQGALR